MYLGELGGGGGFQSMLSLRFGCGSLNWGRGGGPFIRGAALFGAPKKDPNLENCPFRVSTIFCLRAPNVLGFRVIRVDGFFKSLI